MTDHSIYRVEDSRGRTLFTGTMSECLTFMRTVSDCRGPFRTGSRG